jgi:hypothetical protein
MKESRWAVVLDWLTWMRILRAKAQVIFYDLKPPGCTVHPREPSEGLVAACDVFSIVLIYGFNICYINFALLFCVVYITLHEFTGFQRFPETGSC